MGAAYSQPLKRVHLGAGGKYWPGWINVDVVGDQDVNANVDRLPFESNSVDEIQCIHLFEHLERMKVGTVLAEWRRVLKPGGRLTMELPCLDAVVAMLYAGERNFRMTMFALYGDPREESPFMAHRWCWSRREMSEQLTESGFDEIEFDAPKFHIPARDMRVTALKGQR